MGVVALEALEHLGAFIVLVLLSLLLLVLIYDDDTGSHDLPDGQTLSGYELELEDEPLLILEMSRQLDRYFQLCHLIWLESEVTLNSNLHQHCIHLVDVLQVNLSRPLLIGLIVDKEREHDLVRSLCPLRFLLLQKNHCLLLKNLMIDLI